MSRMFGAVVLALCMRSSVAIAQDGAVAAEGSAAEGSAAEGSGSSSAMVGVRVRVVRVEPGTFRDVPVANQEVDVHVVVPPHRIVATHHVTTDAEGEARVEVAVVDGAEVTAEADLGERVFSGSLPMADAGSDALELRVRARTGDPSVVRAARVVQLVELWEGYLTIQQIFTLETSNGSIWSTDVEGAAPIRIELPEDAEGISVIMPQTGAVVDEHTVLLHGEVLPPETGTQRRPSLIVRYSIPHEGESRNVFEQRLTLDVQALSVVVPRETTFGRHPRLDISLTVPMCDAEFAANDGRVCFTEITDDASDLPINEGVDVIVARGGSGVAGESVYVVTDGWPSRLPWATWVALALGGLAFVAGAILLAVESGRRRGLSVAMLERRALERRRVDLLDAVAELEESWQRGEIRTRDRDEGRERLREQLGITRRRLRELGVVEPADPSL